MNQVIASSEHILIIGLGMTGLSVARFLKRQGKRFSVADNREAPPGLNEFEQAFADVNLLSGDFNYELWQRMGITQLIISPGVARATPAIAHALADGVDVIGDTELFARHALAPIAAITGSNGKTTVTTLLGQMARDAGLKVAVGGNIGTPALDLLDDEVELYVVELSSFQLESTQSLNARAACILNITADHLDRYDNMQQYVMAKQRIFYGAKNIVFNRDDPLTQPPMASDRGYLSFGSGTGDFNQFGLRQTESGPCITFGFDELVNAAELKIRGKHNLLNAQAALAMGKVLGLPEQSMLQTLRDFTGLPHRCEFVATLGGVNFYNDSKGTNVGATIAAINGLAEGKNIILIAGGDAKGADFSALRLPVQKHVKTLITIGVDGEQIVEACQGAAEAISAISMAAAVEAADTIKQPGDVVLLSPACASFDMFKNYEDRGEQFARCVRALNP